MRKGQKRTKESIEKQKRTVNSKEWKEIEGKEKIRKFKQTLKENPEIMINLHKKRNQTLKKHPGKIKRSLRSWWKENKNSEQVKKRNRKISDKLKGHKRTKESIEKYKQTLNNNPEIMIKREEKRLKTLEEHPEIERNKKRKMNSKEWKNKIGKEQRKKISATRQGIKLKDWEKFISKEPYDERWNNKFTRLIRKRDNYVCMLCGIHSEKLNEALNVHHINYDKKLTVPQNCISLCRKCHMKTNTNRKHWTKFFQSLLTERYDYKYNEEGEIVLDLKTPQFFD